MPIFLLSCALRAPGRNYEPLWRALEQAKAVQALDSSWFVESEQGAADLNRKMLAHLGPDDGLLILEIRSESRWAATRLGGKAGEWLKKRRP